MRILSVAWAPPYPPDHGTRVRPWNLLRRLAEWDDVTLVTWDWQLSEEGRSMLERTVARLVVLPVAPQRLGFGARLGRRGRGLLGAPPPHVLVARESWAPVPLLEGEFDVAVAEDEQSWALMPSVGCPRVVNRHNVWSVTARGAAQGAGPVGRLRWRLEEPMWRRFDRAVSAEADLSVATTPEAAAALRRIVPGARIAVVSNGVDVPAAPLPPSAAPCAVFVGTMDYRPNVDAAVWLAREIWPAAARGLEGAELRIVGRDPAPGVRRLAAESVRVTGSVPDVVEACRGARVGVVPLRAGSGIKNKTLELMAMGLPVVATPVGAEGIPAGPDDGLAVAPDAPALAAHVRALLADPDRAAALGRAARRFVSGRFSWDSAAAAYREILFRAARREEVRS